LPLSVFIGTLFIETIYYRDFNFIYRKKTQVRNVSINDDDTERLSELWTTFV